MKRTALIAVTILAVMLSLAGCGGKYAKSEYLGTWKARTAELSDVEMKAKNIFEEFTFTLDKSGEVTLVIDGETSEGEWEENDGGFVIDGVLAFSVQDDTAKINYEGVDLTFQKSK